MKKIFNKIKTKALKKRDKQVRSMRSKIYSRDLSSRVPLSMRALRRLFKTSASVDLRADGAETLTPILVSHVRRLPAARSRGRWAFPSSLIPVFRHTAVCVQLNGLMGCITWVR